MTKEEMEKRILNSERNIHSIAGAYHALKAGLVLTPMSKETQDSMSKLGLTICEWDKEGYMKGLKEQVKKRCEEKCGTDFNITNEKGRSEECFNCLFEYFLVHTYPEELRGKVEGIIKTYIQPYIKGVDYIKLRDELNSVFKDK